MTTLLLLQGLVEKDASIDPPTVSDTWVWKDGEKYTKIIFILSKGVFYPIHIDP